MKKKGHSIGHFPPRRHLHPWLHLQNHRADMSETPVCRGCGLAEERADHVLLQCDAYFRERAECFLTTNVDPQEPAWEVDRMVRLLQRPRIAGLEEDETPAAPAGSGQSSDDDWWISGWKRWEHDVRRRIKMRKRVRGGRINDYVKVWVFVGKSVSYVYWRGGEIPLVLLPLAILDSTDDL